MKRLLILLGLSAFTAVAEEPHQLVEALRREIRTEAKALPPMDPRRGELFRTLANLLTFLAPDDNLITDRTLGEIPSTLATLQVVSDSPKVQELCDALFMEIRQRAALNSRECAGKTATGLREALLKGLAATSAKEIDAPLEQVIRLRTMQAGRNHHYARRGSPPIDAVEDVLLRYQDILMATQGAGPTRGQDPVDRLLQSVQSHSPGLAGLIPRSELLEKLHAALQRVPSSTARRLAQDELDGQIRAIVAGIQKPEEMADADQKITALIEQQKAMGNYLNQNAANSFHGWYESYQAVLKGSPLSRFAYLDMSNMRTSTKIESILRPMVLARVLDLPKDLTQQENESAGDFILRAFKRACAVSDWALAGRIADFARFGNQETVLNRYDWTGLDRLRAAAAEEEAGSHAAAVTDDLLALRSGSQVIPLDYIGQRLQGIRQKHPEEYADGMRNFQSREAAERSRLLSFPTQGAPSPVKH